MSSEAIVIKLKQIIREVYSLQDQSDEAKSRTAEILKQAVSSLMINQKKASAITAGVRDFENEAVRYLFERVPDMEKIDQDGGKWFGLYLDIVQDDEKESSDFLELPRPDRHKLLRSRAAIIQDVNGEVTGIFYPSHEDAVDEWEERISSDEPELALQASSKRKNTPSLFRGE